MSKMSLAPVFYTLTHIRFNPIAQMSKYVDILQERLRRSGFPDFRAEQQIELTIRQLDKPQPEIQQQPQIRWSFTNTDRTEGYILLPNALIFHTTEYDTFTEFSKKAISGLNLVHEIVELDYIESIGLRYIDAIVPIDNDALQQYLNPSLLGLSASLEGRLGHSFTETVTIVENGTLVTRAVINDNGLALSPDLLPLQLELKPRFTEIVGRNAVLDNDYSLVGRATLDIIKIENQLSIAHKIITTAFNVSVTDYAREKWA
jgi:uncharacterized protein (TIGR04255 family)